MSWCFCMGCDENLSFSDFIDGICRLCSGSFTWNCITICTSSGFQRFSSCRSQYGCFLVKCWIWNSHRFDCGISFCPSPFIENAKSISNGYFETSRRRKCLEKRSFEMGSDSRDSFIYIWF